MSAQLPPFTDTHEQYAVGEAVCGTDVATDWWIDWIGDCSSAGEISDTTASEGTKSYWVRPSDGGATDLVDPVLNLGNKIFGEWYLRFFYYVPTDMQGYMNIQGLTPIAGGEWVVGNIYFNQDGLDPGAGVIDNSALGAVSFTYPEGEWFAIEMSWDITAGITNATWSMDVAGVNVIPEGTAFEDAGGVDPTGLGGLNFYSLNMETSYYIDDIIYSDQPIAGVEDLRAAGIAIYPNPVQDRLNIQAQEAISNIAVYNVLGQQVYASNVNALSTTIDMSQMASGAYFVQVEIAGTTYTDKIIK
mmetsp:Transcript_32717/g.80143  ORF Transcript_32717/g.80143 Transcript_32717/m.80143 type:complete len:302 (+) Transcript_32717:70-975(+)|eukprot:CAMPEP_0198308892 /NCGR_PEP_ID=MMETSP1450-20131203/1404_1 /TAXON_ID=753684 ORGANISM="Madagascaria erythrocladiodes, Strain CCMP3234" /NCGR_SAMPLE_ID=MMETSP1450 /ASSEMBLY_ACC=CAM_ASM_001115 /LENGTH=301 /DNA_ID=CAMNT_0044011609 /DNA_START=50 /DNA_END=955 /DNA_ORIENTATION=+